MDSSIQWWSSWVVVQQKCSTCVPDLGGYVGEQAVDVEYECGGWGGGRTWPSRSARLGSLGSAISKM